MDENQIQTNDVNLESGAMYEAPQGEASTTENEVEGQEPETEKNTNEGVENSQESQQPQEDPKKSQFVPYERFVEAKTKAEKEAEFAKQQADFYKQQFEAMRSSSQPQQPQVEEDPTVVQAKQVLKEMGFISKDDMAKELQERETNQRAIATVMQQEAALKTKYSGRNLPEASAQDLIRWAEDQGIYVDKTSIPQNFLENLYRLRNFDSLQGYYQQAKPQVAPTVQPTAPSAGKSISEDDFWNASPDKTDEYFQALTKTLK